jgi:hypothetical protein
VKVASTVLKGGKLEKAYLSKSQVRGSNPLKLNEFFFRLGSNWSAVLRFLDE